MTVKFTGKVGPRNRHAGYADPFVVYAEDRAEAVRKAAALSGYRNSDAQVWITAFEEQPPTFPFPQPDDSAKGEP